MKKNQKNNGMSKFQKAVNKLRKEGFLNKPKGSEGRGMPSSLTRISTIEYRHSWNTWATA